MKFTLDEWLLIREILTEQGETDQYKCLARRRLELAKLVMKLNDTEF
ncbi:MAG: hypothetical protein SOR93_17325 [Clostridiales Family XIII bacterium]|nr:hypothetical protein [Hominibacterium faecale]MCI7302467.1 hypothetical protein [Clostridia bacterium]MDY3013002.1 hypothetical protein [Clostridiales Family XIII bacterium]